MASYLAQFEPGSPAVFREFLSTTTDLDRALGYADEITSPTMGVLFKIEGQTGRAISQFTTYINEEEILFPRDSAFVVISKITRSDGFTEITLKEIL